MPNSTDKYVRLDEIMLRIDTYAVKFYLKCLDYPVLNLYMVFIFFRIIFFVFKNAHFCTLPLVSCFQLLLHFVIARMTLMV